MLKSGFMLNYICWTNHGETGVVIEEGEEEQWDDDDIISEYGAFNDTAMGEAEEEVVAEGEPADDLGQAIHDAQRQCESEKGDVQVRAHARGSQEIAIPNL